MSEWREFEFGEIAEIQTGPFGSQLVKDEYIDGGIPVITVENIKDFQIESFTYPSVTRDKSTELGRYFIQEGDVLFSRVGSVDLSALVKKEQDGWIISSRMLRARLNDFGNARFVAYFLQQSKVRRYINAIAVGATMPSINTSILKSVPIRLPQLETQIAIAEVLSSLDDKIDLLKRQNKTLEGMAEALFRQWFIEEAKDDWEYTELGNFVEITNGLSYKSSDLKESSIAMISLKCFRREGGFTRQGLKEFDGAYKERHIARKGDIFIACTDLTQDAEVVGNPIVLNDTFGYSMLVFSMDTVKVEPMGVIGPQFLYQLMRTRMFKEHCKAYANGSTVLHLQKSAIPEFEFFIPPLNKSEDFELKCEQFNKRLALNELQIEALKRQRDTLLPKLMSGEVRVQMD